MTLPEIGPDGLLREAPVIAYTEKVIEEEQTQVKKYIEENYSKIRDVERELANLSLEMKLTAGPKRAALELLRRKIEIATERICAAKLKEEQARKLWEAARKDLTNEEEIKQKLCEDLNQLVKESNSSQLSRLEDLKRRMEALNPSKTFVSHGVGVTASSPNDGKVSTLPHTGAQGDIREKKKVHFPGKARPTGSTPKPREPVASGWTGAGFDVETSG